MLLIAGSFEGGTQTVTAISASLEIIPLPRNQAPDHGPVSFGFTSNNDSSSCVHTPDVRKPSYTLSLNACVLPSQRPSQDGSFENSYCVHNRLGLDGGAFRASSAGLGGACNSFGV